MRREVRFLLNGERVALSDVDPRTTLLDWLREARGLTGTKEGCNEGDCGACTVGISRLEEGRVVRRAANACIQLLPMLDGAAVTTVEALGGDHPVQTAMVERHGSQCGFCTPGIVMSLWCDDGVRAPADVLAGNLCRCTGYGPILQAAEDARAAGRVEDDPAALAGLEDGEPLAVEGGGARAFAPVSEDALAALCVEWPEAVLVAGATDVGLWLTKRLERPATLIFVHQVRDFGRVLETETEVEIGAGASWTAAERALARLAPDLGELVRRFASVQVRNAATVGGNVANGSPIGDGPPVLIALGAEVALRRGAETRRLPLEDFFLDYGKQDRRPGEYVSALGVPRPAAGEIVKAFKVSKRFDQDITAVLGCVRIAVEGGRVAAARIAYGGMAGVPKRARAAEAALIGRAWSEATVREAMAALGEDFAPIDDMRASAAYRMRTARNLLLKVWLEAADPSAETRVVGRGAAA
ncbi:MAG: xanthine dehydrogenase small subunit [Paracoccaceae bacterium]